MAILFRVNLETVDRLINKLPYTQSDADNYRTTRSTWFPDLLRNNRVFKHGDEFEVEGLQAVYLRSKYTSGTQKFLDVVSGSP